MAAPQITNYADHVVWSDEYGAWQFMAFCTINRRRFASAFLFGEPCDPQRPADPEWVDACRCETNLLFEHYASED
jgi:hypothetical protein